MILIIPVSARLIRLPCLTGPLQLPFPSLHWAASRVVKWILETQTPCTNPHQTKSPPFLSLLTTKTKNATKKNLKYSNGHANTKEKIQNKTHRAPATLTLADFFCLVLILLTCLRVLFTRTGFKFVVCCD